MKNYWKYIVMTLLGLVATFHIGAVIYIIDEDYELTSKDYYEQEAGHEAMIERIRAGKAFNWELKYQGEGLLLKVTNPDGSPVSLDNIKLHLYKPDDSHNDRDMVLKPSEDGNYRVATTLTKGLWHARVEARQDQTAIAYRTSLAF